MYAIIEISGTQVKVEKDDIFTINRIEQKETDVIKVEKVLFGKNGEEYLTGAPYINGAYVECEVMGDKRGKKLIAFKYRDRKSSQSKRGHRQDLTQLKVKDIHF